MEMDRYPIGKFARPEVISTEQIEKWMDDIRTLPSRLKEVVEGLDHEALNRSYRLDGWTVRQLVHHIADSHLIAFIRVKLALTDNAPTITPYAEEKWAELPDSQLPIDTSLEMIKNVHERWVYLLKHLSVAQRKRTFIHPESGSVSIEEIIGLYAWHGNHHLAHICNALNK